MAKCGTNDPCPCGSQAKYKKCCRGVVDWEVLVNQSLNVVAPFLSLRGKNIAFINSVAGVLQLDKTDGPFDLVAFKRAFTPEAVRDIYELVTVIWPSGDDLDRVLVKEAVGFSGLYTGIYDPKAIMRGVTRHCLYSDRILLVDPLLDPRNIREQFNPIAHPELHLSTTLRWVWLWMTMMPWIQEGFIAFVRDVGDFSPDLAHAAHAASKRRHDIHPELSTSFTEAHAEVYLESYKQQIMLSMPDDMVADLAHRDHPEWGEGEIAALLEHIQTMRDRNPYVIGPRGTGEANAELLQFSTGTSHELAKLTAQRSRSFLLTDLSARWMELQIDMSESGVQAVRWSPFAKAFGQVEFGFLDNVSIAAALTIRSEGRLPGLRDFFRKVWKDIGNEEGFTETEALDLAAELNERLREAKDEWAKIDRDLAKWFGTEMAAALVSLGPAIALGGADWSAGGLAVGGIASLLVAGAQRRSFEDRYPAGFLLRMDRGEFKEDAP